MASSARSCRAPTPCPCAGGRTCSSTTSKQSASQVLRAVVVERGAHLVVPPLAGAGGVAVAEAGELAVGGQRGDRAEAGPAHVRGDVARGGPPAARRGSPSPRRTPPPRRRAAGAGRPAVHGTSLIAAGPCPRLRARASPARPGRRATSRTANRANSSSAYHRSVRRARDHRAVLRLTVRERRPGPSRCATRSPCPASRSAPRRCRTGRAGPARRAASAATGGTARQNVSARRGRSRARVSASTGPQSGPCRWPAAVARTVVDVPRTTAAAGAAGVRSSRARLGRAGASPGRPASRRSAGCGRVVPDDQRPRTGSGRRRSGPKPVPVPVPSSLANRTPGRGAQPAPVDAPSGQGARHRAPRAPARRAG